MKKMITLAMLFMMTITAIAQEKMTEGVIITKQTMTSDNEAMNSQLAMMGDMISTTYIKGAKSRAELSNPMSGDMVVISDGDAMKTLTLMDNPMLGKKFMSQDVKLTPEMIENIKVEAGDKTKTIIGYECKLYHVTTTQEGVELKMNMYVTEAIAPVMTQQTAMLGDKLKGFPMYIEMFMTQQGVNMTITTEVTELKKEEVDASKFSLTPPEGYTKMEGM